MSGPISQFITAPLSPGNHVLFSTSVIESAFHYLL